jgi:hypothetical protein
MKRSVLVVLLSALAVPCLAFRQAETAPPPKPGPEVQKLGSTLAPVLPLALSAAPSQQQWPRKGDKVFVAAAFEDMLKMWFNEQRVLLPVVPCAELVIKDAKPDKSRWAVEVLPFEIRIRLEGPWLPRMHKTKGDCQSHVEAEGEPKVKRSGDTFTIIPANPK